MLVTKQQEIKRLDELTKLKEDGLHCAESMLESDTKSFLKFFNEIKDKTQKASKELDEARKKKNEKTKELRIKTDEIQGLVSNINKNIELLQQYNTYRLFLESLATGEKKEIVDRKNQERKIKLQNKDA